MTEVSVGGFADEGEGFDDDAIAAVQARSGPRIVGIKIY